MNRNFFEVDSLLEKVIATIQKYHLLTKGERVIVGFSGGVDSLCLLRILAGLTEYRLELWALYINHSLRPAENLLEERLLEEMGERFKVNTKKIIIDIPERLRQKPQSLQLLAREERYRIFDTFRREIGATKVALAHHRDDQAETVFYRIIRGTGLDGLAGIPVIRDGIFIRPLLYTTRAEIKTYVTEQQLTWVEDSSNQKLIYRRNRLRRQLIPEIEKDFNPRFKAALERLAALAAEQRDFMENLAQEQLQVLLVIEPVRAGLRLKQFLELHSYLQYYLLIKFLDRIETAYRVESAKLKRLVLKINNENDQFKPVYIYKKILVYYENGIIFFEKDPLTVGTEPGIFFQTAYQVNIPGITQVMGLELKLIAERSVIPETWGRVGRQEAYFDPEELRLPVKIRFWRQGDSFRPLGVDGTQKLQDFFINNKIPRRQRSKIPLLVDAGERIAWVIGYRLSEEFKVRDSHETAWHLTAVNDSSI